MIKFGTGGWRAIIGDGFTKYNIQKFAQAMVTKMTDENKLHKGIVIGYDRRFLSKEALLWVCEVFTANNILCYFVNRSVPTPLVMHYMFKNKLDYGIMITASHNPALYNGIKVFTYGGKDADEIVTKDIENYIKKVDTSSIKKLDYNTAIKNGVIKEIYPMNDYVDSIIQNINMEAIKNANIKIALDPMYGVSKTALSMILLSARCDLQVIHSEHDTLFGGKMPSPTNETLGLLKHYVGEYKYNIGIATDGDADRLGVIDDKGNFLHPNDVLVILYYYLIKYKKWSGDVVRNIATTHMLDKIANKFGQKCYEVPVGFKNVSAKMIEIDAILGGESSGGLTVRGHINGKDGIYAATLLIEMVAVTGKKLSKIVDDIKNECGYAYMAERDYNFDIANKKDMQDTLFVDKKLPNLDGYKIEKISYLDGLKLYFEGGGWVIVRFSGTEPLIRIFCEMENIKDANIIADKFKEFLNL